MHPALPDVSLYCLVLPMQVLYNQEALPLTELCGSPACDLKRFK